MRPIAHPPPHRRTQHPAGRAEAEALTGQPCRPGLLGFWPAAAERAAAGSLDLRLPRVREFSAGSASCSIARSGRLSPPAPAAAAARCADAAAPRG